MECEICKRGPMQGISLYRANELGVKGIWRCSDHPTKASFNRQQEPETASIEQAINGKQKITKQ